ARVSAQTLCSLSKQPVPASETKTSSRLVCCLHEETSLIPEAATPASALLTHSSLSTTTCTLASPLSSSTDVVNPFTPSTALRKARFTVRGETSIPRAGAPRDHRS